MTRAAPKADDERACQPAIAASEVVFALVPRFNMMALMATIEPLRIANYLTGSELYHWRFVSAAGGSVKASNGLAVETVALPENLSTDVVVYVCASWGAEHFEDRALFAWLRKLDRRGLHLGAMDFGAYVLARAGLLSGHRVAVLWHGLPAFREAYPDVLAEERLFVVDGRRSTVAGGTAGLDAMLHDIAERHGARLAHEVADHVLHHPVRGADANQRHAMGGSQESLNRVMRAAVRLMEENVEEPLPVPEIARRLGISQRKLERQFSRYMKSSAIAYYRALRLQHARVLLTNTDMSVREISVACGYASLSHFAKSFAEQFGMRPRDCRDAWPEADPAPVWPGLSTSLNRLGANPGAD